MVVMCAVLLSIATSYDRHYEFLTSERETISVLSYKVTKQLPTEPNTIDCIRRLRDPQPVPRQRR